MFDSIGGPGRDRTDDLFHAMEARSQTAPQAHALLRRNSFILSGATEFVNLNGFSSEQSLASGCRASSAGAGSGDPWDSDDADKSCLDADRALFSRKKIACGRRM
jgi:hypothetical protein